MEKEHELKQAVTLGELAEFIAEALKMSAEFGRDPQCKRTRSQVRVFQEQSMADPRQSAYYSAVLRHLERPLIRDLTRMTRGPDRDER